MSTSASTTVRISVAHVCADITSNDPAVTGWVGRYFGSWWNAASPSGHVAPTVQVHALVDSNQTRRTADQIDTIDHEIVQYARRPMHLHRNQGTVLAHDGEIAYHVTPEATITITGHRAGPVASAASRLAREALRGQLAAAGWVLLHASAVVDHQARAWVAFGAKGAGKTSTALQLARANNWSILANDRLFARLEQTGAIRVLPWPAAAAIGLGLLHAGSWYDTVAAARDQLHPSTPAEMLDAFAAGSREPKRADGRELKAQLFPDQLTSLLGIPLARAATLHTVLLPTIDSSATHATIRPGGRPITAKQDAFHATTEDRYPPIWGLRHNETPKAQAAVLKQINKRPRWTLALAHDVEANTATLATLDGYSTMTRGWWRTR